MDPNAPRVSTGNATLDAALGGGFRRGDSVLVEGEEGAGATELALTVLDKLASSGGATPRFASALRSPARVARELADLFHREGKPPAVDVRAMPKDGPVALLADLPPGSVLALESASALARTMEDVVAVMGQLADRAHEQGVLLLVLSTPATMPRDVEAALAETADAVLSFQWLESGTARRRLLRVKKVRGLAPVLDGEQIPVYEVGLHRGRGFDISKVKSLI